ncbi:DUF2304 domain-containing protein [Streptomyces sp. NBC_01198]|uniref:DUF2304 domain-containing protein n=1 Tax=Streptomyces sp. NBC_01198 TaxID=2903769 RepID=UPI002E14BDA1|nr:DUF2304 domain-containing protein [Streptomyces sp. NBC_01198]
MHLSVVTSLTGLALLACILELLRRHQLREKYAALWLAVGSAVVPLGLFPQMLDSLARGLGIVSGASLVLFAGIVLLLLVCLHLSWESSRLEEETRTLAEEIALIRTALEEQHRPPTVAARRTEGGAG